MVKTTVCTINASAAILMTFCGRN